MTKVDANLIAKSAGIPEETAQAILDLIHAKPVRSVKYTVFLTDWKKEAIEAEFPNIQFIRPKMYNKKGEG